MPPRRNSRLFLAAALAAGYWCALCVATHVPLHSGLPGRGLDKLYHALAYAGLSLLLATVWSLWKRPSWGSYAAVLAIVAMYGVFDEWLQSHVPGRSADLLDWLADVGGGTLGLVVHLLLGALLSGTNKTADERG